MENNNTPLEEAFIYPSHSITPPLDYAPSPLSQPNHYTLHRLTSEPPPQEDATSSDPTTIIPIVGTHDQTSSTENRPIVSRNFRLTRLPSQLTITDLDPPSLSDHPPPTNTHHHSTATSSTTSNQTSFFNPRSPIPSSLSRRISTASSNTRHPNGPQNTETLDPDWRRRFFEQMNQDFQAGLNRSQAVSRLRQRMNQLRSSRQSSSTTGNNRPATNSVDQQPSHPPDSLDSSAGPSTSQFGSRNLVDILHRVRVQRDLVSRKVNNYYTYLLYCGSTPDEEPTNSSAQNLNAPHSSQNINSDGDSSSSSITNHSSDQPKNHFGDHSGCGKLITVRATLMTPKPINGFMYDEVTGDAYSDLSSRSVFENLLLTSDSYPLPGSADRVDNITQVAFEADPSNLFHRDSSCSLVCSCQRTYLGCLSCGNIVGHTVTSLCRRCQEHSTLYQHSYYLNRLTAIPRYVDGQIPFDLHEVKVPDSSDQKLMSWTQALLRKKIDTDAGYVGNGPTHRYQSPASIVFAESLNHSRPSPLSRRVRNAILMGSVDHLVGGSIDIPRNHYTVDSPSSFSVMAPALFDRQAPIANLPVPPFHSILHSSSNQSLSSGSNNHRFVRAGLTRRPAVRISHHLGGRSGSSSRTMVRPRSSSSFTPEIWSTSGHRAEFQQPEDEQELESKEGGEDEARITHRPGDSRRSRIDDDDDNNDDRQEEEFISGPGAQGLVDRRLNHGRTSNNNLDDSRISRRVVRRRIHRNLDHRPRVGPHFDDQADEMMLIQFSSDFTWSGDVCAR